MSDAASAPTKSTPITAPAKSAPKQTPNVDWRVVVRDSYAAVFDMFGDWAYLYSIYHKDYVSDEDEDGSGYVPMEMLPIRIEYRDLVNVAFAFCVLSTAFALWTVLTSAGRRFGSGSLCFACSVPRLALAGIVLEDLPQLGLTAYIDFTYQGGLSPAGMLNVCSSLNALVNRATARYEQIQTEEERTEENASGTDAVYQKKTEEEQTSDGASRTEAVYQKMTEEEQTADDASRTDMVYQKMT